MKNLFRPCLISSLAILLAACGGGDTASTPATPSTPTTKTANTSATATSTMTSMERGRIMFKRCTACHTLEEGGRNKVGPNLWGIYGAKAGAKEFNYSKALLAKDIVWNSETMDAYIKKPSAYIPGGRMSFIGIKKQEDRDALQEYLRAQTGAE